jgi:hypothetical protein
MKKITIIQIVTLLAIMLVPMLLLAQPASNPYGSGISPDCDAAPIDGGLSLLVAAGVGYGAKKMKERKKG